MPFHMYTNYTVDILHSLPNKSRGVRSPFYLNALGAIIWHPFDDVWCFLASSFTPITSSTVVVKGFRHRGDDWWGVSSLPRFKWTLNIHAVRGITECIIIRAVQRLIEHNIHARFSLQMEPCSAGYAANDWRVREMGISGHPPLGDWYWYW